MKNKRVRWAGIIFVMCLMAGIWNQTFVEASQETEEREIVPGERTATIMVVSIIGNELTYYEVQEDSESESANVKDMTPSGGTIQDGGNMTPPEGMQQDGENKMTPGEISQDGGDMSSGDFQMGGRSGLQSNTKTVYLPVPVVVHTDTDERRTFSILEAGDKLQVTIVTDEEGNETITEIWMLGE